MKGLRSNAGTVLGELCAGSRGLLHVISLRMLLYTSYILLCAIYKTCRSLFFYVVQQQRPISGLVLSYLISIFIFFFFPLQEIYRFYRIQPHYYYHHHESFFSSSPNFFFPCSASLSECIDCKIDGQG